MGRGRHTIDSTEDSFAGELGFRKVWGVAWPIILGSAAQTILNITDTAFLGHLGNIELGAVAMAGILYLTVIMFAFGFGVGTQIVVARRMGEGKPRQIGRVVTHGFLFQWFMLLVVFVILALWREQILGFLVSSPHVHAAAVEFMGYRMWGLAFAHTNFGFRAFYVGIGRTKVISVTTVLMVVVNIVLDYGLIFGKLGLPAMGLSGAAVASVIAEFSAMVGFIIYTFRKVNVQHYRLFSFQVISFPLLKHLVVTALPVMLQQFMTTAIWLLFFVVLERLGEQALAASQIARSVMLLILLPIMGFSSATNTMVSYLMGRERSGDVSGLLRRISLYSALFVASLSLFCVVFSTPVLSIYTEDQNLLELTRPILFVLSVSAILQAVSQTLLSGITGTGRTLTAFLLELAVLLVYLLYAWMMSQRPGVEVWHVWTADMVYNVLLISSTLLFFRFANWRHVKI